MAGAFVRNDVHSIKRFGYRTRGDEICRGGVRPAESARNSTLRCCRDANIGGKRNAGDGPFTDFE
jgi:hypothetical protein